MMPQSFMGYSHVTMTLATFERAIAHHTEVP